MENMCCPSILFSSLNQTSAVKFHSFSFLLLWFPPKSNTPIIYTTFPMKNIIHTCSEPEELISDQNDPFFKYPPSISFSSLNQTQTNKFLSFSFPFFSSILPQIKHTIHLHSIPNAEHQDKWYQSMSNQNQTSRLQTTKTTPKFLFLRPNANNLTTNSQKIKPNNNQR